jgi:hypothetical protein
MSNAAQPAITLTNGMSVALSTAPRFELTVLSATTSQRFTVASGTIQEVVRDLEGSTWEEDPEPSYSLRSTALGYWSNTTPKAILAYQEAGLLTGEDARMLLSYVLQDGRQWGL